MCMASQWNEYVKCIKLIFCSIMSRYHFDYLPLLFLSLVHYYYYNKNILF